jgi:hypothetical protein
MGTLYRRFHFLEFINNEKRIEDFVENRVPQLSD